MVVKYWKLSLFLVAVSSLFPLLVHAREVQWTFNPPLGKADSSPAIVDMNADGKDDLILSTTAGMTLLIDHEGHQVWMSGVQITISIAPTVADLVEDSTPEVLVVNQSGRLFCLAGRTGDPIWQYDLPGKIEWGSTAISTFDLDDDGQTEVILGDNAGHVVCLSNEGELLWQYDGEHGYAYAPSIGIIGDNPAPAIIISGSKVPLLCLNADGSERWRVNKSGDGGGPVIADLDGDGKNEIVTALDNSVMLVDGNGKILWNHPTPKEIDGSIVVADADEDGIAEVYAIDLSGKLVSLAPDGTERWSANVRERVRRQPAIADINGDGNIEIVVAGYSGEMYLFTGDGELLESVTMPHNTNATPTIADFAGDGTPYIVYTSAEGFLTVYKWPAAAPNAKTLWPEYRFSSARLGTYQAGQAHSPVRIADIDFGSMYAGSNTFSVTLDNPESSDLKLEVTLNQSGKKTRVRSTTANDQHIEYSFDYPISSGSPVAASIECQVYDGDHVVAKRSFEAYIVPFKKELNDLETLVARVEDTARQLPKAYALLGESAEAQTRLPGYAAQIAVAGTLTDVERRELRDALRSDINRFSELDVLSSTAASHLTSGQWPLQISAANPWAPFGGTDEVYEGRFGDAALATYAFQGETESVALNIANWSERGSTYRVEIDPLTTNDGDNKPAVAASGVVDILEVINVPTQTMDLSADALPKINTASALTVPGWDARQLWFTIDTSGLTSGTWTTTVHLKSLEVESNIYSVPLTIEVWKTKLADTSVLKNCNWGYVYQSRLKEYEDVSLEDRVAHGNNVFVSTILPSATFDATGKLTSEIDFTKHDEYVKRYSPKGMILFHNAGGPTGPGGQNGDAYKKAYVTWMRKWVAHLKELGVDYDDYAMYPVDEPGLNDGLVDRYLDNAKLCREADPKILMYTDPVARITEEELIEMIPYVDIWCPNRVGFLLDSGDEKLAIMKNSGAEMWNYECEGNAKHQSPLGYYRGQSWLAWHHGLTGIGFWSYCTSAADPWYRPQNTLDYLLVYQGDESVVASKRWEAIRDGVEDYAMLNALREAVASAKKDKRSPKAVREAEALLGAGATSIAQFCGLDDDGTTPGKGGIPGVRVIADKRFAAIQSVRQDIARLMEKLAN